MDDSFGPALSQTIKKAKTGVPHKIRKLDDGHHSDINDDDDDGKDVDENDFFDDININEEDAKALEMFQNKCASYLNHNIFHHTIVF